MSHPIRCWLFLASALAFSAPALAVPAAGCGTGVDGAYSATTNTTIAGGTYNFTSFSIDPGVTVTATGATPLIIYATGDVNIQGSLIASGANGSDGVTYTSGGAGGTGVAGGGSGGAGSFSSPSGPINGTAGSGPGGGGAGLGWSGGGGAGFATTGGSSGGVGGAGGSAYGNATLEPLDAGSGGGGGSGGYECGAGGGGAGGGAIHISSCGTFTIAATGSIIANGGNGGSDGVGNCGGGGGGSGGGIFLGATTLVHNGAISAIGGAGGASNVPGSPYYGTGGAGSVGRIRFDVTTFSGAGTTNPAAASQAPTITSASSTTFTVGQSGTFTVTTNGNPSGSAMDIGLTGSLPSGVTFTDNNDGTATLSGTPASGTGGIYNLTITADNGVDPDDTQSFTLTVNEAPVITSADSTTFIIGESGTFTVTTTGFPSGSSMDISIIGALPPGVSFTDNNDGTATLSGTPGGSAGTYSLTITASNGTAPDATQSFDLVVEAAAAVADIPALDPRSLTLLALLLAASAIFVLWRGKM